MDDTVKFAIGAVLVGFVVVGGGIGGCMYGMPMYNVYHQKMEGEAELAKANFSKQVMVQEAQAKMDSAKMLAEAEVERAKGVARANQIIGDSLKNNEDYLRYLFVNNLEHTSNQVDRKSTRLNSSHIPLSRMPSSA